MGAVKKRFSATVEMTKDTKQKQKHKKCGNHHAIKE